MLLADGGIQKIDIGGPTGLLHYLASFRLYLNRFVCIITLNVLMCVNDSPVAILWLSIQLSTHLLHLS